MTVADDAKRPGATIVLFTLGYPYGTGEPFLDEEVQVLAARADRLVVVPVVAVSPASAPRSVPANTVVLPQVPHRGIRLVLRQLVRRPGRTLRALVAAAQARTSFRGRAQELRFRLATDNAVEAVLPQLTKVADLHARVVFYAYWLDLPAAVAIDVRRAAGLDAVPIIARAHGFDVYAERHASNYLPRRDDIFREVSRVFSVSRAGGDYLRRRWPAYASKVSVAHLGTSPGLHAGNAELECATVVSCSFVQPVKRLELLIDALAELRARGRRVAWSHIGPVDSPYALGIRRRAEDRLEPGAFTFVGGLDRTAVRDWYAANPASVFLNVSSSEGVPVAVMEALAQGLPVVLTDVGGNAETIDRDRGMFDGLLPPDPSPEQVADRLEALLDADPTAYAGYAEASRAYWAVSWSSATNYDVFVTALLRDAPSEEDSVSSAE